MAAKKRKKKRFVIRFELGIGGTIGLGVVCFCIFLWMFLLGVWSGQTVLLPSSPGKGPDMFARMASDVWQQGKSGLKEIESNIDGIIDNKFSKDAAPVSDDAGQEPAGESFFTLQVGSFKDKKKAHREVLGWQARGQDAFFLPPGQDSDTYRVFVGKFDKLSLANRVASELESEEDVRAYITLLPAAQLAGKR